MFKKILVIIIALNIFAAALPVAFADEEAGNPLSPEQIQGKVDDLFPVTTIKKGIAGQPELPVKDVKKEIIPRAIKILLTLAATVAFCVFVYSGVMLVIAQGNEEDIKKFKQALIWSIVGLTFIAASYAIVSGILKISFT